MFGLTVHVEFELSVRVDAHVYPFERAGLHLFEVNDVVPGGPVPVRVEMEIVARETCETIEISSTDRDNYRPRVFGQKPGGAGICTPGRRNTDDATTVLCTVRFRKIRRRRRLVSFETNRLDSAFDAGPNCSRPIRNRTGGGLTTSNVTIYSRVRRPQIKRITQPDLD